MRAESCQSQLPEANVPTQISPVSVGRSKETVASWSAGSLKRSSRQTVDHRCILTGEMFRARPAGVWHFCTNCPHWPDDFEEFDDDDSHVGKTCKVCLRLGRDR